MISNYINEKLDFFESLISFDRLSISSIQHDFECDIDYCKTKGMIIYTSYTDQKTGNEMAFNKPIEVSYKEFLLNRIRIEALSLYEYIEKQNGLIKDNEESVLFLINILTKIKSVYSRIKETKAEYSNEIAKTIEKLYKDLSDRYEKEIETKLYFTKKSANKNIIELLINLRQEITSIEKEKAHKINTQVTKDEYAKHKLRFKLNSNEVIALFTLLQDNYGLDEGTDEADIARFLHFNCEYYNKLQADFKHFPAVDTIESKISDFRNVVKRANRPESNVKNLFKKAQITKTFDQS